MGKLTAFDFRFGPHGFEPRQIHAQDLLDALQEWVRALSAPDIEGGPRKHVALTAIKRGSVRPILECDDRAASVAKRICRAGSKRRFAAMKPEYFKAVQKIDRFAKRLDVRWEFGPVVANSAPRVIVAKDDELPAVQPDTSWRGETSIFGRCIRVGGTPPIAQIEVEGQRPVQAKMSIELAKQLGRRLYEPIGLAGVAHWDPVSYEVLGFEALALLPYDPGGLQSALSQLSSIAGDTLSGDATEHFVREVRGED